LFATVSSVCNAGNMNARQTVVSAGIILYRQGLEVEVLLGHMGGPFWTKKDDNAWSFPKGHVEDGEDLRTGAFREFREELGFDAPADRHLIDLGDAPGSNKRIHLFAIRSLPDDTVGPFAPGSFSMEWPLRSGRFQEFPEIDRIAWFTLDQALSKLTKSQVPFVPRLTSALVELDGNS
jgi:predicted NUDIX family NTP pyrophosphohydrolase